MTYYNTTELAGDELKKAWSDAETQELKILVLFREHPRVTFTPFEVMRHVFPDGRTPITSVRRAITNLTDSGALVKTPHQREGEYGKVCYCWRLNRSYSGQELSDE